MSWLATEAGMRYLGAMRITFFALIVLWGCREVDGEECPPPLPDGSCPSVVDKALSYCTCGAPPASSGDIESGSAVNSEWGCLGQDLVMAPREPGRVQYTLAVMDDQTAARVADLQVQVCANAACSDILALCSDAAVVDEPCYGISSDASLPVLAFDFPYGFDGELRFSAPGYMGLDYQFGGPLVGAPDGALAVAGHQIAMVSVASLEKISRDLGRESADPARGTLIARTLDCAGNRAEGVTLNPLSGDFGDATPFVLTDYGYVSTSDSTDARGEAGFAHLTPQDVIVAASMPDGTELVRSAVINVRPDAVTVAELRVGIGLWGQ